MYLPAHTSKESKVTALSLELCRRPDKIEWPGQLSRRRRPCIAQEAGESSQRLESRNCTKRNLWTFACQYDDELAAV